MGEGGGVQGSHEQGGAEGESRGLTSSIYAPAGAVAVAGFKPFIVVFYFTTVGEDKRRGGAPANV